MSWIILIFSLLVMIFSADWLIKGCTRLASRIGVSEFILSVVIIGIGTTAPEIVISIISSANGYGELAISNALGSNIFLILGVFGMGLLLQPVKVDKKKIETSVYFTFFTSIVMLWTIADGTVSFSDGIVLFSVFLLYLIVYRLKSSKKQIKPEYIHIYKILVPLIAGIIGLYFGGKYFVNSLETLAVNYNISHRITGILIAAPGTSVPELLVTIIAAIKKRGGVLLGNILGSNIANISLAIGSAAFIAPLTVPINIISLDIWVMVVVTGIFCWQLLHFKNIPRIYGFFYLISLGTYYYILLM